MKTLSGRAATGMLWASIGTIVSKFASLGAQFVLGWVLNSEDFALYAIAISWSTLVLAVRNAGTQKLLIQKGSQYGELANVYLKLAFLVNGAGCLLLAICAPILSRIYESPTLTFLIWIIALSLPLNTASLIFQAKLSVELEFRKLTQLNIWSALLRHGSMAFFALIGLGPASFVLPLIVIAVFETIAGWYVVGSWPPNRLLTWPLARRILLESRWVILSSLAVILVMNGDYLAIGLLQSKETLGVYFFGFQLSFSLAALFSISVDSVLMPTFSKLKHEPERQREAFLKAVRIISLGATLVCFSLVVLANPLIHKLWAGKWDNAIVVVQLLALSLPVKLVLPLCRSLMEGCGKWKFVSVFLLIDGIGTMIAGGVGAWLGDQVIIAASVSAYNLVFGLIFCGVAVQQVGGRVAEILGAMLPTYLLGGVALTSTVGFAVLDPGTNASIVRAFGMVLLYSILYLGLTQVFLRDRLAELIALIRQQIVGMGLAGRLAL